MHTNNEKGTKQPTIINADGLLKAIGVMGILLPIVLVVGSMLLHSCTSILNSISEYYHSHMGNYLVGTLCAVALCMFFYNGYNKRDKQLAMFAAICALCVAFFPVPLCKDCISSCIVTKHALPNYFYTVHNISAVLFFFTLAYMAYFQFTISNAAVVTPHKILRNRIYRICGITIVGAIVCMGLILFVPFLSEAFQALPTTFVGEVIALWAFGIAWLTKGGFIYKDEAG